MGLNFRCFRGCNSFRENYSTKVSMPRACAHTVMKPRNSFNENFVDSYPRNLSPIRYKVMDW